MNPGRSFPSPRSKLNSKVRGRAHGLRKLFPSPVRTINFPELSRLRSRCGHAVKKCWRTAPVLNRRPRTGMANVRRSWKPRGCPGPSEITRRLPSSFAARNATFLLALILIASPVAGLRPMRAGRLRTWRMPRPAMRILSPFLRCLEIIVTRSVRTSVATFLDSSWLSPKVAARCLSVTTVCLAPGSFATMSRSFLVENCRSRVCERHEARESQATERCKHC